MRLLDAYELCDFLALASALMLAGLMTALSTIMRKLWRGQADAEAAAGFKGFLRWAATDRFLSTMSIVPVIAPFAMALAAKPKDAQAGYAYCGGAVFFIGFFLWTAIFNLPIYKAVRAWTPCPTPADTRVQIRRFHRSNLVRLGSALMTAALFFMAA